MDRNGRRRAHLDYALFARIVNGRLLSLLRPDLETALREEVKDRVGLRFGCSVSDIDNSPTGVTAMLTDGSRVDADLLVGADGIHSAVRRLVFSPEEAHPPTAMETGGRRYEKPHFGELAPVENYAIVTEYVRRLPRIARPLGYRLGLDVRGTETERRAHSQRLLMVAFRPALRSAGCQSLPRPGAIEAAAQMTFVELPDGKHQS